MNTAINWTVHPGLTKPERRHVASYAGCTLVVDAAPFPGPVGAFCRWAVVAPGPNGDRIVDHGIGAMTLAVAQAMCAQTAEHHARKAA